MNRTIVTAALLLCAWLPGGVRAQEAQGADPVAQALIAPEVVMAHQDALGLSDAQRKAIQDDVQGAQQRFTHTQWQLAAASEKLVSILKQSRVDQGQALAALDAVLNLERDVKHTQLTLMIQIKNELTASQQERARSFAAGASK